MLRQTTTGRRKVDTSGAASAKRTLALIGLAAVMVGMLVAPASANRPVPGQVEPLAEAVRPVTGISGLAQAFALGKFDAELIPASNSAAVGTSPLPRIIAIDGKGGLYDALIAGKFETDFASRDAGVKYVRTSEPAATAGGLWAALDQGKLDAGLTDAEPSEPPLVATHQRTIRGGHQR